MELALFLTPWKKWKFCVDRRIYVCMRDESIFIARNLPFIFHLLLIRIFETSVIIKIY